MKTIGIVFGGKSGEHVISIISARSVANAINREKFNIVPIYISTNGTWFSETTSQKVLNLNVEHLLKTNPKQLSASLAELCDNSPLFGFDFSNIHVILPMLHGTYGEDGTIQGLLSMHNVPFIGCNVATSALCMDKALCKRVLMSSNIPTLPFIELYKPLSAKDMSATLKKNQLHYPVFVKPANSGSSVGISKVKKPQDIHAALQLAFKYDTKVMIEQGLNRPREIELGILRYKNELAISSIGEIIPCNEFYDFNAKYINDDSELIIPAKKIPTPTKNKIKTIAKNAATILNIEGLSRIDFFIDTKTNHIYLNEINTMPGFTPISMYPKLFNHAGLPYAKLIEKLISYAEQRYKDNAALSYQHN